MDSRPLLFVGIFVCTLLPVPPDIVQIPETNQVPLDPQVPTGVVKHTEIGRVVPYNNKSVVLLWGDELQLAYAPSVYEFKMSLASGVSSFTLVPGANLERVLVADGSGLYLLDYDFAASTLSFIATPLAGTQDCAGAVGLTRGDWNGDGLTDFAAISAARQRVYLLTADGSGGYTPTSFDPSYGGLRELEPIAWDADAPQELAVLSDWGTEVYDASGIQLFQRVSLYASDHVMTVLRPPLGTPAPAKEAVAVVQRGMNGTNRLLVVHRESGTDTAVGLGNVQVVGIDAGDCDQDGDEDLGLSIEGSTRYLRILYDAGSAPHFASTPVTQVVVGSGGGSTSCDPALADLDDDGLCDFAMGIEQSGKLVFDTALKPDDVSQGNGGWAASTSSAVQGPFQVYRLLFRPDSGSTWNTDTTQDRVEAELRLSNYWGTTWAGLQRSHIEVTLWGQELGSLGNGLTGTPRHFVYQLPLAELGDSNDQITIGFELPNVLDVPPNYPATLFSRIYYAVVCPANYNPNAPPNQKITGELEQYIGGFTFQDTGSASWTYLNNRYGACSSCSVTMETVHGGTSTRYVGGFVPQNDLPALPSTNPQVGEPIPLFGFPFHP